MARGASSGAILARKAATERRGASNTRLYGGRRALVATAEELVERAGDMVRAEICEPGFVKEFCSTLKYGASRECMDRTCINAVLHITKLLGEERNITVEFIHRIGASSEEQLKGYVEAAKSVEGASLHDSAERCVAFLELFFNAHPELRSAAVKRLGGYVPVEAG